MGDVNLTTGEGITDKCASVLAYKTLTATLPANSFFLCNVRPECILQENRTNCQPCDNAEMEGMITLVKLLTQFVKEVGGSVCYMNLGGKSTNKIGKKLIERQILPSKMVSSTGYHMCNLVSKNAAKTYEEQQYDVSMFVESLDTFLTDKFCLAKGSILRACIEHPKLRFVVDIDPKTKLETEASKELRKEAKLSRQHQRRRDRYNAMSPDEKEAFRSRERQCRRD